jgi:2,6-dihydroxypseudooxynicotine hydrolase
MYRRFTWRILSNYVSPWEFERNREQITDYEQWCAVWSQTAAGHVARGEHALQAGHRLTAGDAFLRAGLCFHWANFMFTHDQEQLRAAFDGMADAWRRASPNVAPEMELLEVGFEGVALPGYLRRPADVARPPLMVAFPGADSNKEELYNLGEHFVARGMAFAAFDGPGQGAVSLQMKMRADYELAIRAVLDELCRRDDLDSGRIAAGGISYGGLFSLRAAAVDDRIRAAVSVSSWYSPGGRFETMEPLSRQGQYQYLGADPAATMAAISLEGVGEKVTVPVLQVFGELDPASPPSTGERVAAEVAGPVTTLVYPDGVHILNNIWYRARADIADWVHDVLAES